MLSSRVSFGVDTVAQRAVPGGGGGQFAHPAGARYRCIMILLAMALAQASTPFGAEAPLEALDICATNRALTGKKLQKALYDAAKRRGWTKSETDMLVQACASYADGIKAGQASVKALINAEHARD